MADADSHRWLPTDLPQRRVIGCMSGTSLDGLDVVLVHIRGHGNAMTAEVVEHLAEPFEPELRNTLRALADDQPMAASAITRASRQLGETHAALCRRLIDRHGPAHLVVPHGQTVCHLPPTAADTTGHTWQMLDPWPIAQRCGAWVCLDLRQADVIAGGQGAPITPIADPILYPLDDAAALNLGGVCNVTRWRRQLGGDASISGGDVWACNLALDGLVARLIDGARYDEDGNAAAAGTADPALADAIERVIREAIPSSAEAGRSVSLGREQFGPAFAERVIETAGADVSPNDLLTSATEAVARGIVAAVSADPPTDAVVAGGGVRHRVLVERIRAMLPGVNVRLSEELGVASEAREAAAMAVLGTLAWDGEPITLPNVTGARKTGIAGAWIAPQPESHP
ncbi:MAG: anhydro-N-acetylmuramic acid kinase [Planctomycetota bacterium]